MTRAVVAVLKSNNVEFVRPVDNSVLARGETDWVYVDAGTGRPRSSPDPIRAMFEIPGAEGGP